MNTHSIYVIITAVLALLNSACSQSNLDSIASDSIVYCSESDPNTFNPQLDTYATTADASSYQIYNRLIEFDPINGKIVPSLASSWLVSKDGLTYTFQLRRGVNFHTTSYFTPTRSFNADDVVFSINRWRNESHPYHNVSGGRYPYFQSLKLSKFIKDVKKINGYRIQITLNQRDSSFLANLATDFSIILSAEYAKNLSTNNRSKQIDSFPIGTGPFKYQDYTKGQVIYFKKHEGYWKDEKTVNNLVYDITPKSTLRLAKLVTGECDVIAFPSQSELDVIVDRDDLVLDQSPSLNIGYWAFNTQKAPFNDPNVRRALAYAIDKNSLLETVYLGKATPASTLIPPTSWAHSEDVSDTSYNPILARRLLDEAGIEPGFTMTIWANPLVRDYNPNAKQMAELIQQYLADVLIEVNIVNRDWTSFIDKLNLGEHDSVLLGWSADNGDPDNFYRPLLSCDAIPSGTNVARWCNKDYDQLVYQALQTDDIVQRQLIYKQVNHLIAEQIPIVPIAHSLSYQAYNKQLIGLTNNPYGAIRFSGVSKAQ